MALDERANRGVFESRSRMAKQVVNERATPRVDKRREEALAAVNRRTLTLPSYVVPVFAAVLALVAIIVLP